MPLSHYTNIIPTATNLYEPLYSNLFEITFSFPTILGYKANQTEMNMMMLNATNIELNLTPELEKHQQYFKYAGRQYLNVKKENSIIEDLEIKFNVNVDDNFTMTTWNLLKQWYDLGWRSSTGELSYKREMIGGIVCHQHDRQGVVINRVEFVNVQLFEMSGMELTWEESGILDVTAHFCADYWLQTYFDIK